MITVSEAAKRSLELALDEAMDALDELLHDADEDDTRVIHQIARIVRLEEILKAMP